MATFTTINIPNPPGLNTDIGATGGDAAGDVVGYYGYVDGDGDPQFQAFTYDNGTLTNLNPPLSTNNQSIGITDSGEIFGTFVDNKNVERGFTYGNGTFTTISEFLAKSTAVSGVSNNGTVFGTYVDLADNINGFTYSNGIYTTISYSGASATSVDGVTASGEAVGTVIVNGHIHGFTDQNGSFATFDPAGSTDTDVSGVTASGEIVGTYTGAGGSHHGYALDNGVISVFDPQGSTDTYVSAVNDSGEVVGYYVDHSGNVHGFVEQNGGIGSVDVPNSIDTEILGINDQGQLFGLYDDTSGTQHGFIGTGVTAPPPMPDFATIGRVAAVGDFNHDGYDDLAYYNASLGTTQLQLLNGTTTISGGKITNSGLEGAPGYTPVASGDFNKDGASDLVYYDSALGDTELQFLNGATGAGGGLLSNSSFEHVPGYVVAGVGDFNKDGYSDLVYYNASLSQTQIQFLNGATGIGGGIISNTSFEYLPGWTVAGVGDFNKDGYSDLVYYDASLGDTQIQFLNGTTGIGGGMISNSSFENLPGWTIAGVGDFNGDGKDDLVYYNASLGVTQIQFLNGTTGIGGGLIQNSSFENNPAWAVVGVGDFNGDGFTDLAYYDASTAQTAIQFLNGTTAIGGSVVANSGSSSPASDSSAADAVSTSLAQLLLQPSGGFATDSFGAAAAGLAQLDIWQPHPFASPSLRG